MKNKQLIDKIDYEWLHFITIENNKSRPIYYLMYIKGCLMYIKGVQDIMENFSIPVCGVCGLPATLSSESGRDEK